MILLPLAGEGGRRPDEGRGLQSVEVGLRGTVVLHAQSSRRFRGYKFRRQRPIGGFIVVFCSVSLKLVIELDGATHANELQQDDDDHRTRYLERRGFTVIRVRNDDVRNDPTAVADYIELAIQTLTLPSSASGRGL